MKTNYKISKSAIASSLISLVVCSLLIITTIVSKDNAYVMQIEQLIHGKSNRIEREIASLLFKTEALSALIVQYGGETDNFDIMAPAIVRNPIILNVLLAPGGVVSKVYPLEGNENVIGLDFFAHGAGNREAVAARNSGALVLGGPFDLVQGGRGLVGRLPIYMDTPAESRKFWGLVSVTLKFPDVLDNTDLHILTKQGFSYEIWRINPDTDEKQVIIGIEGKGGAKSSSKFVERPVKIFNAEWFLKVSNLRAWYSYPDNIFLIFAGFFVTVVVFFFAQNRYRLKQANIRLAALATIDPLTGILNRRHFMELAHNNMSRAQRRNEDCYLIIFDADKFKNINDTYGHLTGDKVLVEIAVRLKNLIRPYDLFARYGGEEFIIFVSNPNENDAMALAERLRLELCEKQCDFPEAKFYISASFGVAKIHNCDLKNAINNADTALYKAKNDGRNRVVFYNSSLPSV